MTQEQYTEVVFGHQSLIYQYKVVGLPGLQADDYLESDNPLAPALGALMKPSRLGKVTQKYRSLVKMVRSGVDEARLTLLTNVVEQYLKLNGAEQTQFATLMDTPDGKEVEMVVSVYEQRGIEQGIERGVVRGKISSLLYLMEHKFGTVSDTVRANLGAITDTAELDRLLGNVLTAQSIEEMGLE